MELGRALGLTQEQIDLLDGDGWKSSDLFDARDKAVIRWAEAVTERTANGDDGAFAAMRAHFDDREIVELTLICSMWNLSNRFAEALRLVVEPPGQRIAFQPADLGEGAADEE